MLRIALRRPWLARIGTATAIGIATIGFWSPVMAAPDHMAAVPVPPLQLTLPAPTGPDHVGVVSLHLIDHADVVRAGGGRQRQLERCYRYGGHVVRRRHDGRPEADRGDADGGGRADTGQPGPAESDPEHCELLYRFTMILVER